MKRKIITFLLVVLTVFAIGACKKENTPTPVLPNEEKLSIALNVYSSEIYVGDELELTATVNKPNKNVVWSSDNTQVVSIANGKAIGLQVGVANVLAKVDDQIVRCKITVSQPLSSATKLELKPKSLSVLVSYSFKLNYNLRVANQIIEKDKYAISFTSSDNTIATIDNQGIITGVSSGFVDIVATAIYNENEYKSTLQLGVDAVYFIELPEEKVSVLLGKSVSGLDNDKMKDVTLNPIIKIEKPNGDLEIVQNATITYESLNPKIARIDNNGKIIAESEGECLINISYENKITQQITANVFTPIQAKADLDYLAYAAQNGKAELWDGYYMLSQDIDFSAVEYSDKYLLPIAAQMFSYIDGFVGSWGVFGNLNPDNKGFRGIIDGNGFSIKNAIIPMGTAFETINKAMMGNNFIGILEGKLTNIAFIDLIFERQPEAKNTKLYSAQNSTWTSLNIGDFDLYNGYICIRSGVVGENRGVVENVYLDTTLRYSSWTAFSGNGGLVAVLNNGRILNCVASLDKELAWTETAKKQGAICGYNYTAINTAIQNCFVVSASIPNQADGLFVSYDFNLDELCVNYACYTSVSAMFDAQRTEGNFASFGKCFKFENNTIKFGNKIVL